MCVVQWPDLQLDDWLAVSLASLKYLVLCYLDSVFSSVEGFDWVFFPQGKISISPLHIFAPYAYKSVSEFCLLAKFVLVFYQHKKKQTRSFNGFAFPITV